ncbi:MAG: hypothetical protein ACI9JM_003277 [Halioglobus sp.]|jgi:hypothetical protein
MSAQELPRRQAQKQPSLSDCALALTPDRRLWLEQLDRDAGALLEHLAQRSTHRLGIYFEQLWHFFLQQDPLLELVAHNLAIHHGGRTLGEFDCIYFCHQRQRHVHLELAVKYFLGDHRPQQNGDTSEGEHWLGPDAKDRLDLKMNHLLERQIRLSEHTAAQQKLSELGIASLDKELAVKGYLFKPRSSAMPPPLGFNSKHSMCDWVRCADIAQYTDTLPASGYFLLPKMQWLSPAYCEDSSKMADARQLQQNMEAYFAQQDYPLLVAALDQYGVECGRFFVTDNRWPDSKLETVSATP